jgi:hypothetical protein
MLEILKHFVKNNHEFLYINFNLKFIKNARNFKTYI